ncbi:tRNA (N(6)-L-threonylcarbamoyladenosine(37)-C(2))-methylthiotransferase MtaB [bacterium M21]|nr:tRNA (N(6)-L-threonylcarbamoyladenosine(37)-C(2))-methylthiotransferase MtaB [bacterium M21]
MKPTISFFTLGCRLNKAETATLERYFEASGYQVVDFKEPADIVVVNTCTVTANGDADTRRLVNKVNRQQPNAKIALIGCQAQLQAEKLAEMNNVQWVVGTTHKMELPVILAEEPEGAATNIVVNKIPRKSFTMPAAGIDHKHTRANLKVQDGCDFYCTYCEIPYARGHARSREFDDILSEAAQLTTAGHHELVLTGINVGCYDYKGKRFPDVIEELLQAEDLLRLRISSIEPTTIGDEVLALMTRNPKLCRHLHIPMQSGCNETLARMKRRYSVDEFEAFVMQAYDAVPGLNIGTDVMVGFPGETEEEFETTRATCERLPYAYMHVFSYSERKNARSSKFEGIERIPPQEIARRSKILHQVSDRKRQAFMEQFIGTTQSVLVEQEKKGFWSGLTDNFIRVHFPAARDLTNQLVEVTLEEADGQLMRGKLA